MSAAGEARLLCLHQDVREPRDPGEVGVDPSRAPRRSRSRSRGWACRLRAIRRRAPRSGVRPHGSCRRPARTARSGARRARAHLRRTGPHSEGRPESRAPWRAGRRSRRSSSNAVESPRSSERRAERFRAHWTPGTGSAGWTRGPRSSAARAKARASQHSSAPELGIDHALRPEGVLELRRVILGPGRSLLEAQPPLLDPERLLEHPQDRGVQALASGLAQRLQAPRELAEGPRMVICFGAVMTTRF